MFNSQELSDNNPLGVYVDRPKFPQYSYVSRRIDSYRKWPEYLPIDPQSLVEAGLVYTGYGDSVRCYYCGGGMRNWERGDDPMVEHAKWYPSCPHVKLVKGDKWIEDVCKGNNPTCGERNGDEDDDEEYISMPAAQSCIQMGYDEKLVSKAISKFLKLHNHSNFSGLNLCEILEMNEVEEETAQKDDDETATSVEKTTTEVKNEEQSSSAKCSPAKSSSALEEEEFRALLNENKRLKESRLCKICLDKRYDVVFLPCGHLCTCPECAPALHKCPICRSKIKGYVKAYLA